jgi:type II secretory pathway pseudopilin PulG
VVSAVGRRRRRSEAGYNLVILAIAITVMGILLAAALPLWSQLIKRDKEEELRFRGLQYAEAIRVFQARFGRFPVRLEELIEVKPRSIRQLWKDPMTESGKWGLVFQGGEPGDTVAPDATAPQPAKPNGEEGGGEPGGPGGGGPGGGGETVTVGPIIGVYSLSREDSLSTFFGQSGYRQWVFRVDILHQAMKQTGGAGIAGAGLPAFTRMEWLGRPFRPFLQQGLPLPGGPQVVGGDPTGGFPGGKPGFPGGGGEPGGGFPPGGGGGAPGFPGGGGGAPGFPPGGGGAPGFPGGGGGPGPGPTPIPGNSSVTSVRPFPS